MNQIIKPTTINIQELVNTNTNGLSINFKSKMVDKLNETFTNDEQKWFILNYYIYMNYHPTNEFPINLEHIFKIIGFAHKKNAKRTLENNFTINEDYKITVLLRGKLEENCAPEVAGKPLVHTNLGDKSLLLPREQNKKLIQKDDTKLKQKKTIETRGRPDEIIMLNVDTFKNLCMMAKTDKGKEIRKYYVKLENIYNSLINEERLDNEKLLLEQKQINIQDKETVLLQNYHKKNIVYFILIEGILWKFGWTNDIHTRLLDHKRDIGKDIKLIWCIESKDNMLLESELKEYLKKTNFRKEQKFKTNKGILKIQTELIEINDISIIQKKVIKINNYIELDNTLKFKKIEELELKINELQSENKQLKKQITNINSNENTNKNTIKTITGELKIKSKRIRIRRENVLQNTSSDEEKQKFITWLNSNVQKKESKDNCALNWCALLTKYLGYKTNPMISGKFRAYFQEYIGDEYIYSNFKYKGKTHNGWRNLSLTIN